MSYTLDDLRRDVIKDAQLKNTLRAETLRAQLDPAALLDELFKIIVELDTCDKDRVPALNAKTSILLNILKKCMPDLRSIEVVSKSLDYPKLVIQLD